MKTAILTLLFVLTSCGVLRVVDGNTLKGWKGKKVKALLDHPTFETPVEKTDTLVRYVFNNQDWWVWDSAAPNDNQKADVKRDCNVSFTVLKGIIMDAKVKEKCKTFLDVKP